MFGSWGPDARCVHKIYFVNMQVPELALRVPNACKQCDFVNMPSSCPVELFLRPTEALTFCGGTCQHSSSTSGCLWGFPREESRICARGVVPMRGLRRFPRIRDKKGVTTHRSSILSHVLHALLTSPWARTEAKKLQLHNFLNQRPR